MGSRAGLGLGFQTDSDNHLILTDIISVRSLADLKDSALFSAKQIGR